MKGSFNAYSETSLVGQTLIFMQRIIVAVQVPAQKRLKYTILYTG